LEPARVVIELWPGPVRISDHDVDNFVGREQVCAGPAPHQEGGTAVGNIVNSKALLDECPESVIPVTRLTSVVR